MSRAPLRDKDVKRGMRKRDVNDEGGLGPISGWIHLPNLSGSMSQPYSLSQLNTPSIGTSPYTGEREEKA